MVDIHTSISTWKSEKLQWKMSLFQYFKIKQLN